MTGLNPLVIAHSADHYLLYRYDRNEVQSARKESRIGIARMESSRCSWDIREDHELIVAVAGSCGETPLTIGRDKFRPRSEARRGTRRLANLRVENLESWSQTRRELLRKVLYRVN